MKRDWLRNGAFKGEKQRVQLELEAVVMWLPFHCVRSRGVRGKGRERGSGSGSGGEKKEA